jgi:hypothetical protein
MLVLSTFSIRDHAEQKVYRKPRQTKEPRYSQVESRNRRECGCFMELLLFVIVIEPRYAGRLEGLLEDLQRDLG